MTRHCLAAAFVALCMAMPGVGEESHSVSHSLVVAQIGRVTYIKNLGDETPGYMGLLFKVTLK